MSNSDQTLQEAVARDIDPDAWDERYLPHMYKLHEHRRNQSMKTAATAISTILKWQKENGQIVAPKKKTLGGHGKTFDVMDIANDLKNSDLSQKAIARKHGCRKATVQGINKGQNHSGKTGATEDKPLRRWTHAGGRPRNR